MGDDYPTHRTIANLVLPAPSIDVWAAEDFRDAPGWSLAKVDVVLDSGRPFGSVTFQNNADGQLEQVAVHWDHVHEQLHCFVVNRAIVGGERKALELDARSRVGNLVAIYAEIGANASRFSDTRAAIETAARLAPEKHAE